MNQWVLLALLVASSRGDTDLLDQIYDSNAYKWVGEGVTSGCQATELVAKVEVSCALQGGRITFTADSEGQELQVMCEDSTYVCDEIQQARPYIANGTYVRQTVKRRAVRRVTFDSCQPPAPLSCALALIAGSDVQHVTFKYLNVNLTAAHFDGLQSVQSVVVMNAAPNVTVPYTALTSLKSLRYLKFTGGVSTPSGGTALQSLKKLELADSVVPLLERSLFSGSPDLVVLSLWGDTVGEIAGDAFWDLPLLQNVSLNSNGLTSLPPTLFSNSSHITYLDLYNNDFNVIQTDTFQGLKEIKEIRLYGNRVPLRLEDSVFANLPTLTNLVLHENDIANLPPNIFSNSTNIQTLNLSHNKLATLHPIFAGVNLITLDLSHNLLQVLPADVFRDQTKLKTLDISHNNLTVLPDELFLTLSSLNVLRVVDNKLGHLDGGTFAGLSNLNELYLDRNNLHTLHRNTFNLIPDLHVLSLSHNFLSFSSPTYPGYSSLETNSPFSNLKELIKLDLNHNMIDSIWDDWRNLVNLKVLDLSYNRIAELTDIDLNILGPTTVDLRYNNITTIRIIGMIYMTNADASSNSIEIQLDHNPYNCDCSLYTLLEFMKRNPSAYGIAFGDAQCVTPPDLSGNKLSKLSPDQLVCQSAPCPAGCTCLARPASLTFEVYCNKSPHNLTELLPNELPDGLTSAELFLKSPVDLTSMPSYVKLVNLTGTHLADPPQLKAPTTIDLRDNNLTSAPIELLQNNCSLYLAKNPFKCDCSYKNSLEVLRDYRANILDYSLITCDNLEVISSKNIDSVCVLHYAILAISALALLTVLSISTILCYYKNRVFVRILLRKLGFTIADVLPDDIKYDAFVSFAHQDENIVTNRLLPNLEGRKKLKLCIHTRDWLGGDWIPEQIARSVDQSRCTIIVLSKHFIDSIWASFEFRTAHTKGRIVILVVDDVYLTPNLDSDLKAYITLNTYIKLDDPLVWERLNDAILVHGRGNKTLKEVKDKIAPVLLNVRLNKDGKLVNTAPGVLG
ncbi:protein toll-like isoform X2 [Zerene cesonia]|nr:protein toll-like isoform X2 [Zerene cesonia]